MGKTKKSKSSKGKSKMVKSARGAYEKIKGSSSKNKNRVRRKKSPQYYAKEILRLRLKKRLEKMKYSIR